MLDAAVETVTSAATHSGPSLYEQVEKAIAELKPHLMRDGGDIELITIEGNMVVVDMTGNCSGCALASVTLAGVKKRLIEMTGRPLRVIPLSATTIRRPEKPQ